MASQQMGSAQTTPGKQDACIIKLGADDVQALYLEADLAVQQRLPAPAAAQTWPES